MSAAERRAGLVRSYRKRRARGERALRAWRMACAMWARPAAPLNPEFAALWAEVQQ